MFTVVVPVFNHRPYLLEAILSAARSRWVTEVLVADDGSRDGSAALVRVLASGGLGKVRDLSLDPPRNIGAHATLNRLVEAASNEWVAVLNSDDFFPAARFDVARLAIVGRNVPQFLFGDLVIVDAAGRPAGVKRLAFDAEYPYPAGFDAAAMLARGDAADLLASQNLIATTSNMMFTRDLWQRVGGFAPYRYVHDWDFALRAALLGRACYLPQPFTGYRLHGANTISESATRTDEEVADLFDRLLRDFPELADRDEFQTGLASNRHLKPVPLITLSIQGQQWDDYAARVREWLPGTRVGAAGDGYVYDPESPEAAMPPSHLASAALAVRYQDADFVLVSRTLADPPRLACRGALRNNMLVRAGLPPDQPMRGRVARLLPDPSIPVTTLPHHLTPAGSPTREWPLPVTLAPAGRGSKPVMFILPALFAVGGVERVVTSLMHGLRDQFDFVVITVEPIAEQRGSLEGAASELALAFFHLGELLPPDCFISALEQLRDTYQPALVYVPNSNPWQCSHALEIRRIFARVPLVDQSVYDSEVGWIVHMNDPGMRAADRFIAVNTRVRDTLASRYGLPPDRIDLIYPSIDLSRFGDFAVTAERRKEAREALGLPAAGPVYAWAGRMVHQKRPVEFAAFARRAIADAPDAHFLMIGDGDLAPEVESIVKGAAHITRKPFVEDMGAALAAIDGLLIPSRYEGLPCVMLEALAFGIPVLSTDAGDIRLVLEEYGSGRVVDSWDDFPEAFAHWHVRRGEWAKRALAAAPAIRERFGGPAVARQYLHSFRGAMAGFVPLSR